MQFSTYIITLFLFGSLVSSFKSKNKNPPIYRFDRTVICDKNTIFSGPHLDYGTEKACSRIKRIPKCFDSGCIRTVLSKLNPSSAKIYRGTLFKINSALSLDYANPHSDKILYEWEMPKIDLNKHPKFKFYIIISFDTQSHKCAFIGVEMRSRKAEQSCKEISNNPDQKPSPKSISKSSSSVKSQNSV
ncbi:hypothetical protein GcM3_189029 [Golovinomyces cichoracearum]|uniref:Secreted effector protein n=1 Tax=Golovinomyces cichoracearum TaxID=62708 RepID=A0A420HIM9_9PEZI|nr:hypothetical protein GcM3_189029 [Golovinomyces cichoracearum]